MGRNGTNPNSLKNLEKGKGFLATDPAKFSALGTQARVRRGIIRRAAVEAMESGYITVTSKDAEILDSSGNVMNVDFSTVKLKVPNYVAIAMKLQKEAVGGNIRAIEILIGLDENYENRKLKNQQKDTKLKEDILQHFQNVKTRNRVEEGEVIPYEELNREID